MRDAIVWLSLIAASCGTPATPLDAAIEGPFTPGVSGGPLSNRLEVIAVDELTLEPVEASVTVAIPDVHRGDSPFALEAGAPIARADVTVTVDGLVPVRIEWVGVRGRRVVIPIPRRPSERRTVEVRGATALGANAVRVTALAPLRILRHGGVGAAAPACAALDPCRVNVETAAGSAGLIAIALGADDAPMAFAIAAADATVIDMATARPAISIPAALPAAPEELDAVVGVPGLAMGDGLALLPLAAPSFVVPSLDDETPGDASLWLLARAHADGSSSTVVQRGLRGAADAGAWPAFLSVPTRTSDPLGEVRVGPPADAGATLFVVEVVSDDGAILETLYFEPPEPIAFRPGMFVRAIDAGPVDASAVDLAALERRVVRWSDASAP